MSRYGWAFVNSIVTGAAVTGPDLGIVVNNGGYASSSATFRLSGSTGSLNGQLNVTGNVIISGTLYAQQYTSTVISSSIIYTSGSTKFGDDTGDTHVFTGSLYNTTLVSGSTAQFIALTGTSITASNISGTNFDINGGAIDNTSIGTTVSSSGKFTTLSASSTLDVGGNTTLSGNLIVSGNTTLGDTASDTVTVTAQITGSQFDINGGTIDNTAIGATAQNSGKFTTLSASSTLDVAGNTIMAGNLTISGNVILGNASSDTVTVTSQITGSQFAITGGTINNTTVGATTQASGRFTTLSASSTLDVVGVSTLTTLTASSISSSGGASLATNLTVGGNLTVSGNTIFGNASSDTVTVTAQITGSQFAITGGTINNTSIGATQQSTGQFTTLSASSTLDVGGVSEFFGDVVILNGYKYDTTAVNANYSASTNDTRMYAAAGAGGITISLPTPGPAALYIDSGREVIIRKISGAGSVTINVSGGANIVDYTNASVASVVISTTLFTRTFAIHNATWYEINRV